VENSVTVKELVNFCITENLLFAILTKLQKPDFHQNTVLHPLSQNSDLCWVQCVSSVCHYFKSVAFVQCCPCIPPI